MEKRLIDANAIKLEKGFFEKVDNVPKFYEWLGKQPTVDAVPVVRCENCKYKKDKVGGRIKCAWHNWWQLPDFYCKNGAKMDGVKRSET